MGPSSASARRAKVAMESVSVRSSGSASASPPSARILEAVDAASAQHDRVPGGGEGRGGRRADARRGAGDDRRAALRVRFEAGHQASPSGTV
jgi:hypothetical protein